MAYSRCVLINSFLETYTEVKGDFGVVFFEMCKVRTGKPSGARRKVGPYISVKYDPHG